MASANKSSTNKRKINRQWEKAEIKILIEEYEARSDLWDPQRPNYMNRNIKQKLIAEIATKLDVTADEINAKFHSLRAQFNRECSKEKQQKSGSGSNENYTSKWEFMSSLRFLKAKTVAGETRSSMVITKILVDYGERYLIVM